MISNNFLALFCFFAYIPLGSTFSTCPPGAVKGPNNCYSLQTGYKDWNGAELICQAFGGHLASISSAFDNSFLVGQAQSAFTKNPGDFWVGGCAQCASPNTWAWSDRSPWGYTNWASNQPSSFTNLAININSGQWISTETSNTKPFICEVPSNANCTIGAVDLVFVLDKSGSIGATNFQLGLAAIDGFVEELKIGPNDNQSHVGLVTFNDVATVEFDLSRYVDANSMMARINKTVYSEGGTNIAAGMDAALKKVFGQPGDRSSVQDIMILITDGQDNSNVAAEHTLAVSMGVTSYALGVGSGVDLDELTKAVGSSKNVFNISDWTEVASLLNTICTVIANATTPAPPPPTTTTPTTTTPPTTKGNLCSSGWTYYSQTNMCYQVVYNKNFDDAESACNNLAQGSTLVSIHSADQNNFLAHLASTNINGNGPYFGWIGMHNVSTVWNWLDASPFDYSNWADGQPFDEFGYSCGTFYTDAIDDLLTFGFWTAQPCNLVLRTGICEIPANK